MHLLKTKRGWSRFKNSHLEMFPTGKDPKEYPCFVWLERGTYRGGYTTYPMFWYAERLEYELKRLEKAKAELKLKADKREENE
ncbi:hypothetical protein [Aquirhabdus parva]|uniref:Uncharacterized protein n=1 Tax=Aquirhabdus parva TaxID=2283318 RepID=A0A345PAN8_9GAMM|nr:hypothetical protein [Aquirhabdus parva]AXI04347.1 hypothetical protein HYN46_16795 [Aquirhabdus parva]AXI04391.1 hypothetical protein HYN46_17040 [Aquirhabdus parva]